MIYMKTFSFLASREMYYHCYRIKHDSFELERFYLNILRDFAEIFSFDPTAYFWENEFLTNGEIGEKEQKAKHA